MQTSGHRNEPNRPHIPSILETVKERSDRSNPSRPQLWRNKLPEPLIYRTAEEAPAAVGPLDTSRRGAVQAKSDGP
jgi:hypothetical protein